jgi:hypothetical protein
MKENSESSDNSSNNDSNVKRAIICPMGSEIIIQADEDFY